MPAASRRTLICPTAPATRRYLNDYGSKEAQQLGQEVIERELGVGLTENSQVGPMPAELVRSGLQPLLLFLVLLQKLAKRKLAKVNEGERDLYI